MARNWIIVAGGGLLLVSSFASALIVAHELGKTSGAGLFGIAPLPALIGGLLLMTLGIAGVGLGAAMLQEPRTTAVPGSPATSTGPAGVQDAFMPAAMVATRLETLLALQATSRAAGLLPAPQTTSPPNDSWRDRLTDPTVAHKPAPLTIPRIQRQPGSTSGDGPG